MSLLYNSSWALGQALLTFGLIKTSGLENVPASGGVILAANHQSYFDPPFLGFSLRREAFYVAKKELYGFKPLGWLLRQLNTVPIKRGAFDPLAYKKAIKLLLSGRCLVLFPEGTRSRGDRFLEPKLGVGLLALEAKVPIVPVYLENTRGFLRLLFTRKRVSIRFGQPLEIEWLETITNDKAGYQQVVQELMRRIESLRCS